MAALTQYDAITGGTVNAVTQGGYALATGQYPSGTYFAVLEKHLAGGKGVTAVHLRAVGEGASLATAEANALTILNELRLERYGHGTGTRNLDSAGTALTDDVS